MSIIWDVFHCVLHVYVLFLPSSAPGTPPRNIQAKGLSDTSFEATWLPPSQPNGAILGYRLYYVTDPKLKIDQWLYKASADNQTQITGLLKMTTYYFKLIAYNSAGEGPLSDLFAVKTAQGGEQSLTRRRVIPPVLLSLSTISSFADRGTLGNEGSKVFFLRSLVTQKVGVRLLVGGERYCKK